jgi:hypothetical protein
VFPCCLPGGGDFWGLIRPGTDFQMPSVVWLPTVYVEGRARFRRKATAERPQWVARYLICVTQIMGIVVNVRGCRVVLVAPAERKCLIIGDKVGF